MFYKDFQAYRPYYYFIWQPRTIVNFLYFTGRCGENDSRRISTLLVGLFLVTFYLIDHIFSIGSQYAPVGR